MTTLVTVSQADGGTLQLDMEDEDARNVLEWAYNDHSSPSIIVAVMDSNGVEVTHMLVRENITGLEANLSE